jgi:uncharacterized membrane protein YcaP (DUF421 family)
VQIIVRAAVLYLFIWLVTRGMGRRELSELSAFELIMFVVLGDLIQQGVTGDDRSVVGAMLAVTVFALLTLAMSYATFRWKQTNGLIQGVAVVVVRDGRILREALTIERLGPDEVKEAAREQGIDDLRDVELGVLETDGQFSFRRYGGERPPRGRPSSHMM